MEYLTLNLFLKMNLLVFLKELLRVSPMEFLILME
jgi:hypothetical protein